MGDDLNNSTESGSIITGESTPSEGPEAELMTEAAPSARLYFLTNRMNLNGVLSSRLIAPRDSFHKYYADLLELCPGWVPVLTETPAESLIQQVVTERGAGGPVLLELAGDAVDTIQPTGAIAYVRAVPFSKVTAIHFPDEKSLREHRARGYKNVQPHEELLKVSPELFQSESKVEELSAPPVESSTSDWSGIDRVRGAVNGLLAASDSGEALTITAIALGAERISDDVVVPPWLNWDTLTGSPSAPSNEDAQSEADRLLFGAAYRILGQQNKAEAWSPRDVLEEVALEVVEAKPSAEAQKTVDRSLQRVRELLSVEREFEPFRNPGGSYVAAKSLLMVLLRPDLDQLLEWPSAETGADETTRSVAALLAGRLRGLSRESVKLRNVAMDDLTAEWAVRVVDGSPGLVGSPGFVATESETHLLINGKEVRESAPLVPDPVVLYQAMNARARPAARVAISRSLGWPVVVRLAIPPGSDVKTEPSMITITSIDNMKLEPSVEEVEFLEQLRKTRGELRRKVADLLKKPKS